MGYASKLFRGYSPPYIEILRADLRIIFADGGIAHPLQLAVRYEPSALVRFDSIDPSMVERLKMILSTPFLDRQAGGSRARRLIAHPRTVYAVKQRQRYGP
jgi:hypothetical protein